MRGWLRFGCQFALVLICIILIIQAVRADHVPYQQGDVFAGVGKGKIKHFSPTGSLLETLDTTSNSEEEIGMCFDSTDPDNPDVHLYTTNFTVFSMSKFNNKGGLLVPSWGGPFSKKPESCVVDTSGNIYVGEVDGGTDTRLRKFDLSGNLLATYNLPKENRGIDWIDLAADQCTIFYTSEGRTVKRFNVCTNTPMPDFATGLAGSKGDCFALRIRSNGEVLVTCTPFDANQNQTGPGTTYRLNPDGSVKQTYQIAGEYLFAMNLDPDGRHFWTAGYISGNIYKVDIETGAGTSAPLFNGGKLGSRLSGLAIFGETPPPVDLSITKAASPEPVKVGNNLTYALVVNNNGSQGTTKKDKATQVTVTDTLPAGVNLVSTNTSQGNCSGTSTITCNLGTLEKGKSVTVTIVVRPTAVGTITNTAAVLAFEKDPDQTNNTASATTTVKPLETDLSATKAASPNPVFTQKDLTYSIAVTNKGPDTATGVILTDTLPSGVSFGSANSTQGNCSGTGTVTCNLGALEQGKSATVTIVVTAPSTEGAITNTATVKGNEKDPVATNNTATTTTTVMLPPCERQDIVGLMCALKFTVNNLDLLFNQLDHGLYETLVAVNNGRKLLSQGRSTNLVDDSVTEALEQINLSIETFAELHGLIDLLNEQLANALGTIATMLEAPDLTPAQSAILTKLKLKVEAIELITAEISNELEVLQDKLDAGQPGISDIRSALEAAQGALANDNLDDARTSLNSAYQLIRVALRESKRLVRKKKLIIKNLVSAEGLLSHSTLTSQSENTPTIPAQQTLGNDFTITESIHGSILFQTLDANVKSLRLRVYAISGRLVFDQEASGSKVSFEGLDSRGTPLANGVYLVVLTAQRGDGSRIASQLQKIVWVR